MAKIQEVPTADSGTNFEPLEQVHHDTEYNVFANELQHFEQSESISNTCLVETDDSNVIPDSPDMCDDDIQNDQNDVESDDKRVALANLIANLNLDVDENKKIKNQLKKANIPAQELKECKNILAETSKTLEESNSIRDSWLVALQNKQTEFEKYKAFNDRTIDYDKLERKLNETLGILAQKDIEIKEGLKLKAYEILVVKEKHDELIKQILLTKSHYEGLVKLENKEIVDNAWVKHIKDQFRAPTTQDMDIMFKICLMPLALKTHNDSFIFVRELKQEMHADLKYVESFEKEIDELKSDKAEFSNMYDMILQECVSSEVMCTYLLSLSNLDALAELQCLYLHKVKECDCLAQKLSKQSESVSKEVYIELLRRFAKLEKHSISLELALQKYKEQNFNVNAVCATCRKCLVVSDHFACVTKMLNDMNARTKKPNIVPISTRKPKAMRKNLLQHPIRKKVASKSTTQKPKSYYKMLFEKTSKAYKWWIEQQCLSGYKWVPKTKMQWVPKSRNENVQKRIVQLILFIVDSGCTKHMTGNIKLLCNFVENYRGLNHNLFSVGQFCDANLEVAFWKSTCFVRDLQCNDLLTGNCGSNLYTISLQESTSSSPLCLMAKASPTQAWLWHRRLSHLNFDYINMHSKKDVVIGLPKLKYIKDQLCSFVKDGENLDKMKEKGDPCILTGYSTQSKGYRLVPQRQKAPDYDNSVPVPQLQNVSSSADAHVPSQQKLNLLFGLLYDEFFTTGTSSVNKSSSPTNNSNQQDTQPTTNIQPTSEPSTPTYVHAKGNHNNQTEVKHLLEDEFTNLFCTLVQEVAKC
nr:hypothetical protein [Tanacetum cinerariifolium]